MTKKTKTKTYDLLLSVAKQLTINNKYRICDISKITGHDRSSVKRSMELLKKISTIWKTQSDILIEEKIHSLQNQFHLLKFWTIKYNSTSELKSQSNIDYSTHNAVIYAWCGDMIKPTDYELHELLHVCMVELKENISSDYIIEKKREEKFIQDLCKIIN